MSARLRSPVAARASLPRAPLSASLVALLAMSLASCSHRPPTASDASVRSDRAADPYAGELISDEVVVVLRPGVDPGQVAEQYGTTFLDELQGVALFRSAEGGSDMVARTLATDPRVVSAEPNVILESAEARQRSVAFDDGFGSAFAYGRQPAGESIHLYAAHYASLGSASVPIAILDTGVDSHHPALAGHLGLGRDFLDKDGDPTDVKDYLDNDGDGLRDESYGHGTHVAGIVALTAPASPILMVRVLDADGRGDVRTVAAGLRWAIDHGARVINLSLGMLRSSTVISMALDDAAARGIVVLAAAGNWGAETQEYPAVSNATMAVAAVDAVGAPADFTSYGSFVELCAPGVAVRSAYPGGGYRLWSGTSMSTAFVSGTAAMLLALHPTWRLADVMNRLQATARPIVDLEASRIGKLGAGALDAGSALILDLPPGTVIPPQDGLVQH